MMQRLGVSVISLLPWSIRSFHFAIGLAASVGFSGIQLLPIRGLNERNLFELCENFVISVEGAWNSGNLLGAAKRLLGISGEEDPTLKDVLIFGETMAVKSRMEIIKKRFQSAIFINHGAGIGPVEMNPELGVPDRAYAKNEVDVVWDNEHITRKGRHGEPPVTTDWRKFLQTLDPTRIKMIHYKPSYPTPEEAKEMLIKLSQITSCPVVLEARPPNSHFVTRSIRSKVIWLKRHYDFMESILSG
jgi:hypothetical protein